MELKKIPWLVGSEIERGYGNSTSFGKRRRGEKRRPQKLVAWTWKVENWDENGRCDDCISGRGEDDFAKFLIILRRHGLSILLLSERDSKL